MTFGVSKKKEERFVMESNKLSCYSFKKKTNANRNIIYEVL